MNPSNPVIENVRAVAELGRQAIHHRTLLQRLTDGITAFAGNPAFIAGHAVWFAIWILLNQGPPSLDPYPAAC